MDGRPGNESHKGSVVARSEAVNIHRINDVPRDISEGRDFFCRVVGQKRKGDRLHGMEEDEP